MPPKSKPKGSLGKRLAAIRAARGEITQEDAAELIGVSRNTWRAWEVEGVQPSKSHMKLIALLESGKI